MKVLLLADIHANLPALEAVLAVAGRMAFDEVWCLGDTVGYGPFPNECVHLIQKTAVHSVVGNHDLKVISSRKIQEIIDQKKEPYKVFVFSWTHRVLSDETRAYLGALPKDLRVMVDGHKVLLVHGSPESIDDCLSVYTPDRRLAELASEAKVDFILAGHTHGAFSRKAGGTVFINPGSVGRPFDGDFRASFAMLQFSAAGVQVDIHRVAYDTTPVVQEMRRQEFPAVLIKAFIGAISPADVLPEVYGAGVDLAEEAQKLGDRQKYEKPHAWQVAKLALKIFDGLAQVHGYGPRERALLQAAALLHDVGIARGAEGHHKASRDIILEDKLLPLSERERVVVALIARYHRRALPKPEHRHFSFLPDHHQALVQKLGGILRMADGLDRSHQGLVKDLDVENAEGAVRIILDAAVPVDAELAFGSSKSDLFEKAFGKKVKFITG